MNIPNTSFYRYHQGAELHPVRLQSHVGETASSSLHPEYAKPIHTRSISNRIDMTSYGNNQQLGGNILDRDSNLRLRYAHPCDFSVHQRDLSTNNRNIQKDGSEAKKADKENMFHLHQTASLNDPTVPQQNKASRQNPLQDLTNINDFTRHYSSATSGGFRSRALYMESDYQGNGNKPMIAQVYRREAEELTDAPKVVPELLPSKEVEETFCSRPIVHSSEIRSNSRVVYSYGDSPSNQNLGHEENSDRNKECTEKGVNSIVGKKKGKSTLLVKRMRQGLDIDTNYNSNGNALILLADEGDINLRNLVQDNFKTRAGFFEVKRG